MIDRIALLLKIREYKELIKREIEELKKMDIEYTIALPSCDSMRKYKILFQQEMFMREAEISNDEIEIDTKTAKEFFEMANDDKYDNEIIEHTINDIKDFENKTYEENRAEEINLSTLNIQNKRVKSTSVEDREWPKEENIQFLKLFEKHPMNFEKISEEMSIPFSDIILHFYHVQSSKKRSLTNRERDSTFIKKIIEKHGRHVERPQVMKTEKKKGRMRNENIDRHIAETWSEIDRKKFEACYEIFTDDLSKYGDALPEKSELDLKMYLNYFKRKEKETHKKIEEEIPKDSPVNYVESILNGWSLSERSIFALYYPYVGKNWNDMATYIPSKELKDFRMYFKYYFKNLSPQEQELESTYKENKQYNNFRMSIDVTPTGEHVYNGADIQRTGAEEVDNVGFVFNMAK